MRNKINLHLIEYSINSILRQKYKNMFISITLTLLTALLTSMFFITNSIKHELNSTVDALPQIIVQKMKAGRHYDIDVNAVDKIIEIAGVSDANARIWGYYYFENAGVNFTLVGLDEYESQYKSSFEGVVEKYDFDDLESSSSMAVGEGVKRVMNENYYKDYFNFIKPNGEFKKVNIAGVFDTDTQLESNDIIVMPSKILKEIFDMAELKATDIVVKVANKDEIPTVISKIKNIYPSLIKI